MKIYLDDHLVFSTNLQEKLQQLCWIFQYINRFNPQANLLKSEFSKTKVKQLGYIVSKVQIAAYPSKNSTIQDWPAQITTKQLQSFSGLANYYQALYIPMPI